MSLATDGVGRPTHAGVGIAGRVRLSDGRVVQLTTHCVDRFWERAAVGSVRFRDALDRLTQLASSVGEAADERPDWAHEKSHRSGAWWLYLGPDVALCIEGRVAVTCLVRGMSSSQRRHRRKP